MANPTAAPMFPFAVGHLREYRGIDLDVRTLRNLREELADWHERMEQFAQGIDDPTARAEWHAAYAEEFRAVACALRDLDRRGKQVA